MEPTTDELRRVRALYEYKILDSDPETSYEDITYLAAKIYQAPISMVSLVDKDRHWSKSRRGIHFDPPLENSLCAYVVKAEKALVVNDASKDPRFQNYGIVSGEPHIRFYAGVPLITPDGYVIGALCVLDVVPRNMDSSELHALEIFSRQVVSQLELRKTSMNFQTAHEKNHEQHLKLIHHAKLASLGEMAASIAHEINNPLTIINGNVSLLRRVMGKESIVSTKLHQYLDSIEKTVYRIDKIIRGLKALSHGGESEPFEEVDLRESLSTAISMVLKNFRTHGIEIRELYKSTEAKAECRSFQVEQIIINLLTNTFDAIKDLPEKWVEIQINEDQSNWKILITDSGKGIPFALQSKIMMPFFTTKEVHQGTGLGLSISKGLAEEHSGTLELERNCANTKFILTLPKTQT